jgi:hypothetical protein
MLDPMHVFRRTRAERHEVPRYADSVLTATDAFRRQLRERLDKIEDRAHEAERRVIERGPTLGGLS